MNGEIQDEVLLRSFVQDDSQRAFAALAQRYAGLVFHVGMRFSGSAELAEEAAQNTFVILAKKAARLDADLRASLLAALLLLGAPRGADAGAWDSELWTDFEVQGDTDLKDSTGEFDFWLWGFGGSTSRDFADAADVMLHHVAERQHHGCVERLRVANEIVRVQRRSSWQAVRTMLIERLLGRCFGTQ